MARNIMRLMLAGFFAVLTLILHLLGNYAPKLVFALYPSISQNILSALGGFFSVFPLAMWELLALALLIWILYTMIRDFSQLKIIQWLTGVLMCFSIGVFVIMLLWGLNYYSPPMHEKIGLSGKEYSLQQLQQATIYYRDMANRTAYAVPRNGDGTMDSGSFPDLAEESVKSFKRMELQYDCFEGPKTRPKRLLLSGLIGLDGIFVPFTGECGVSPDTYSASLSFTMCRELGRRVGFVSEDEAEFAAFLACSASDSAEFRYSGYFNAFSFCYNALYAADQEAAEAVWEGVSSPVRADCAARWDILTEDWKQLFTEFHENIQDTYTQSFETEDGERPEHDSVVQLLTMWYYERIL